MTPGIAALAPRERIAVAGTLDRLLAPGGPPIMAAVLFGSKARGDHDLRSDVDLLLICDIPPARRARAARACARAARAAAVHAGARVETWTVAAADLAQGRRTPMLVDALDDGLTVWPTGAPPLRLPFTPSDACYCATRLLDWVHRGEVVSRGALKAGRPDIAAARARDDITRLATAALLLTGSTRHRRRSSLIRFRNRFLRVGLISDQADPAVRWALRAFPPDGGRGRRPPPPTPPAVRSAVAGLRFAGSMRREVVPWILHRMDDLLGARLAAPDPTPIHPRFSAPAATRASAPPR